MIMTLEFNLWWFQETNEVIQFVVSRGVLFFVQLGRWNIIPTIIHAYYIRIIDALYIYIVCVLIA